MVPAQRKTAEPISFGVAVIIMELMTLKKSFKDKKSGWTASVIFSIVLVLLITWEVFATVLAKTHPVLIPPPENVFAAFRTDYKEILQGIYSSLKILFIGSFVGIAAGTVLGFVFGWHEKLREVFFPIASVLAPIPAIVYSPYVIALVSSFKVASIVVVTISIF